MPNCSTTAAAAAGGRVGSGTYLQSRSPRWMTLPCLSPKIWNSMCRAPSKYRSSKIRSSPNEDLASDTAEDIIVSSFEEDSKRSERSG